MTEQPTIQREGMDQASLETAVREALAQVQAAEQRLQAILQALGGTAPSVAAPPPTASAAPVQEGPVAVDTVAWEVQPDDLEIPISHPDKFRTGQIIAIGDGPTREIARIRAIMGSRLLCVRGIEDTSPQQHAAGRHIYIVS